MLDQILCKFAARAFIFDMDGTLVDNMDHHRQAWGVRAQREGLRLTEAELLPQTHGTIGEIVRRLFLGESDVDLDARGRRKEEIYRELYAPHLAYLPGVRELLEEARARNVPMAVATAGDRTNINFTLDGLGARSFFKVLVGGDEVTRGKPDPEVFLLAAAELGIAAANCLVFEDSPAGVEAARRAGMKCIVVNPMNPRDEFGDMAHVLQFATDYTELA